MTENAIQAALARGVSEDALAATIVAETGVSDTEARQIIAQERGDLPETWDDVIIDGKAASAS